MGNQHGTSQQPRHGVRPTDKDPKPSEGQDEKDLGEDEGTRTATPPTRSIRRVIRPRPALM